MRFNFKKMIMAAAVAAFALGAGLPRVRAAESLSDTEKTERRIPNGIYAGSIDLSGMTAAEANQSITNYMNSIGDSRINMTSEHGNIEATGWELGFRAENYGIGDEAARYGHGGNIVTRYKASADLLNGGKVFDLGWSFDRDSIVNKVTAGAETVDVPAVNAGLTRKDGGFTVTPGSDGYSVNVEKTADEVYAAVTAPEWAGGELTVPLIIDTVEPLGKTEDLQKVTSVLGTFTTRYYSSGAARCSNIANGCRLVSGSTVYPGEEFSVLQHLIPFSEENGYELAGSYLNGEVVDSLGGGICQVSTTLYNAVLRSELQVTERHNHSMIVNYVDPSDDAAIAESSGKDFKFVNNLEYPVYIDGYTADKTITFTIYGCETRDPSRTVNFESVVLEETDPGTKIVVDNNMPAGKYERHSAHRGYKAELWKVVTENGNTERTRVNSSSYKPVPATVTIGGMTADPSVYNMLSAAASTNDPNTAIAAAQSVAAGIVLPVPAAPQSEGGNSSGSGDSGASPSEGDGGGAPAEASSNSGGGQDSGAQNQGDGGTADDEPLG